MAPVVTEGAKQPATTEAIRVLHDGGAIYNSYNSMANPCRDVVIRGNLVFYKDKSATAYGDMRDAADVRDTGLWVAVGAIGVSGGSVSQDMAVVDSAVTAFQEMKSFRDAAATAL